MGAAAGREDRGMDPVRSAVAVEGGDLQVFTWGEGPHTVLAVHGITASAYAWPAVAAALPEGWRLVAPDLRGRGLSRDLPGPCGLLRHAADVCLVAEGLRRGGDGLVLAGHSMGAYVAVQAACSRPDLFDRLVIVDGGVPLPVPEGADPDAVLEATLGPALARLGQTYADADAYVDFFRQHPALGPHWSDTVEGYVRHDVLDVDEGVRSRAREPLVRDDGRDLLVSGRAIDAALRALPMPSHLLSAPGGMFGDPPGLLPADAVRRYADEVDVLTAEEVPDVNHYTILFEDRAASRVAAAIVG